MQCFRVAFAFVILMTMTEFVLAQDVPPPPVENLHRTDADTDTPATCALTASLSSVPPGGTTPSTLTWTTTFATRVTLNRGTVAIGGTLAVRPLTTATYTLTAYGSPGTTPATCVKQITVTQPSCANGAICPVTCGTGMIPDIRNGNLITLDPAHMVHVLLVAEGYTASDLSRFSTDVSTWLSQWGALEIYDDFREAFCFWKLPAVSNQNIVPGGAPEDTAFRIPVDSGGGVDLSDPLLTDVVEQRIWAQISRLPYPPATFYPTTASRTRGMARNLVVSAMLYDTARGKAGFNGTTSLLENPGNASQTVATAFAQNYPHEFTHAFARLRDEYMILDGSPICASSGPWTSGSVSNVVCTSSCSSVPWSHLMAGGTINPSVAGLVGAFGIAEEGYHSELKCLMNGDKSGNATVFGGETELRDEGRMCNFCRELTAFRLFERIGQLPDTSTSYATWQTSYRQPFFATYGLDVPATVPMETPPGRDVYTPCN